MGLHNSSLAEGGGALPKGVGGQDGEKEREGGVRARVHWQHWLLDGLAGLTNRNPILLLPVEPAPCLLFPAACPTAGLCRSVFPTAFWNHNTLLCLIPQRHSPASPLEVRTRAYVLLEKVHSRKYIRETLPSVTMPVRPRSGLQDVRGKWGQGAGGPQQNQHQCRGTGLCTGPVVGAS